MAALMSVIALIQLRLSLFVTSDKVNEDKY